MSDLEMKALVKFGEEYKQYATVNGQANPSATTHQQMQHLFGNWSDMLERMVANMWQPNTAYELNQVVWTPSMPANMVAICTNAGSSGAAEPSWPTIVNDTVTDGAVVWSMVTEVITGESPLGINQGGTGATNAYDACVNLDPAYKLYFIKSHPSYFYLPSLFTCTYTSVTLPKGIELNINGEAYISTVETTLLISTLGTAAELAGKDVYIYACQGEGTEPVFTLSLNSTVPDGYTADNSRKIGGFHCECLAVGSLTNVNPVTGVTEAHKLTDLGTGEIIAPSRWDLWHKPTGKQTEGMSYIEEVDVWIGIYGASWDGTKLVHTFGGIWADGTSTKKWHGELSLEALMQQGMRLPWRHEFQCAAKGSNEQTNIKNSADPGTTGAHVDTAGRRMVSNYGLEDCCGVLWQWLMDLGFAGGSGWTNSAYDSGVDPRSYGQTSGTLYRLRGGGGWRFSSSCGSRCAACANPSADVASDGGCRGASEPLHQKGEKRRPVY